MWDSRLRLSVERSSTASRPGYSLRPDPSQCCIFLHLAKTFFPEYHLAPGSSRRMAQFISRSTKNLPPHHLRRRYVCSDIYSQKSSPDPDCCCAQRRSERADDEHDLHLL